MTVRKKIAQVDELQARLIREIRRGRANSRLKLAKHFRLAPSTVGIYVDRLVDDGYLGGETSGWQSKQRGRPAQRLHLRKEAGCFIGAEFEAESMSALCVDFAGNILSRHVSKLPPQSSAEDVLAGLEAAMANVRDKQDLPLLGAGIGVPGIIDAARGIAREYRFIQGWRDIPVAQKLQKRFQVPISLENNARATALGNLLFEKSIPAGDFISLLVRSGVGAGIIINGALYHGESFLAGEVGRIQPLTPATSATHETLEDIASTRAILRFVGEELKSDAVSSLSRCAADLSIQHVINAVRDGDDLARKAVQRSARGLGWLAHLVSLTVDPGFIVLVGPLNALGEWFRLEVQAALNEYSQSTRTEQTRIHLSQMTEEAGALGAASLAIDAWQPGHGSRATLGTKA